MKYLYITIGIVSAFYACVMIAAPFAIVHADNEAGAYADRILNAFTESWNAHPDPSMGRIISAKVKQIRPWTNFYSVGALFRVDIVFEQWKGFLEIYASKHGEKWRIDKSAKGTDEVVPSIAL